jgi:SSS family solute:Na+ symporter
LITIVCIIVFIGVSYATKQPDYVKIKGLTFSTLSVEDRAENRASWNWKDVVLSVLLVLAIIAVYAYFTG